MSKPSPSQSPNSAVSEPIQRLIALFTQHLAGIAFPDVDATRLESLAGEVRTQAERVAWARAELASAEGALASASAALDEGAARGLGYAKVFAGDDEDLREQLESIRLDGRKKVAAPRKRRTPKTEKRDRKKAPPKVTAATEPLAQAV